MTDLETLLDYRRSVARLYHDIRTSTLSPEATCARFRTGRDALFRAHPQSALDPAARARFGGLRYFPYNPALRLSARVAPADPTTISVDLQDDGPTRLRRFGQARLAIAGQPVALALYWVEGYGGGLFLPFRDASAGAQTYGGGRYLLDTIKGADLGHEGDALVLDFNYAYNPSCAYDDRWHCPLAPAENRLPVAVEAGEMLPPG
jgi:hypothetical protein